MTQAQQAAVRAARAVEEALSWVGTPYHHCADIKGAGVDCAMLLVCWARACGFIGADVDPRPYAPAWAVHRGDELFLGWLQRLAAEVPTTQPAQAGDVQVWRYGRCFSHGAICLGDGRIVHALKRARQVVVGLETEPELMARPARRFRLPALITEAEAA